MPFNIKLDGIPAGYALKSAKPGQEVLISLSDFTSSEDGDLFIKRLEGFPSKLISMLPPEKGIHPSTINHMLAIIYKNKNATVYVNELKFIPLIQVKRNTKAKEKIFPNDVADIQKLTFDNVSLTDIPNNTGIAFLFSIGWRKAFFFDFWPIKTIDPINRTYDLEILLGQCYAYLFFQELFKITKNDWEKIFNQKWFPFISLNRNTINSIINYARNDWNIDYLLPQITQKVKEIFKTALPKWRNIPFILPHIRFIQKAIYHFNRNDFLSAISILYPRIEGILRSHFLYLKKSEKITQDSLVKSAIKSDGIIRHNFSLLLPDKFTSYLLSIYFENFDPFNSKGLSRHTVSHGVAKEEEFSLKAANIGFLILDQLSYYLKAQKT